MRKRLEPADEPVGQEARILKAIGTKGKLQVELNKDFSNVESYVQRLKKRGLIRVGKTVKRYRAPSSNFLVLTDKGKEVLKRIR